MYNDLYHHPFSKLLAIVFIMIASFFAVFSMGYFLAIPVFGISFSELSNLFANGNFSDQLHLLKYFQTIQTIGLFVLPPFIIARLYSGQTGAFLGFASQPKIASLSVVIVMIFFALPFINFLSHLNQSIPFPESLELLEKHLIDREEEARRITYRFLDAENIQQLLVNLLMVAVLPALGEELLFRGILQKLFAAWARNIHLGILIAAIVFSAMHIQFYGFIPRVALGILFGYLFYWSGSIWLPITGHFVNNGSAVIFYYIVGSESDMIYGNYGTVGSSELMVIFSGVMIGLCCYLVYMYEKRSGQV
ncbi:MAG: CPBP family intramembrane glutamic endopeptidase [Bacteroidales bacterium]|nr:CPBP family intramembrane metalloprotease [Bacteroidales bacterium]